MKTSTLVVGAVVAIGAYLLLRKQGGGSTETDFDLPLPGTPTPSPIPVSSTTPRGDTVTQKILSPRDGVNYLNDAWANGRTIVPLGATIIPSNSDFQDNAGNKYRTGSNQTVSKLADGQVKVLTVKPVSASKSFFSKPIKTINGKRTRVY